MSHRLLSSGSAAVSFALVAGLAALTPGAATAASAPTVTVTADGTVSTRRVSTADLDLTAARDLKRLDARIRGAIGKVCDDGATGHFTMAESLCRADARRSSDRQVAALRSEATALAAAAQAKSGSEIAVVAAR
jgi:UrcA family protein